MIKFKIIKQPYKKINFYIKIDFLYGCVIVNMKKYIQMVVGPSPCLARTPHEIFLHAANNMPNHIKKAVLSCREKNKESKLCQLILIRHHIPCDLCHNILDYLNDYVM